MVNSRLRTSIALVLMTLLLCAGSACMKRTAPTVNSSSDNKSLPSTPPVRTHGWTLSNNQRMTLANYKGKVVVLDFYATWCEPCRAETPHLVRLQQQYADQGLQIIGLNVGGEDDRAEVPAFAKEFSI